MKLIVHNNCRINFRNRICRKESQEKKIPVIIEEKAMEESFDQLECENAVWAKRQETKDYNRLLYMQRIKTIRYRNI